LLSSFPNLQTYLVAYGDMPSLQQAAARAVFGRAAITGKLPISLPGLYARGTGIAIKETIQPVDAARAKGVDNAPVRTAAPPNGVGEGRPR